MKLVPERTKFYETLALGNSAADMERFVTEFSPILEENHNFLVSSTEIHDQRLDCIFFT